MTDEDPPGVETAGRIGGSREEKTGGTFTGGSTPPGSTPRTGGSAGGSTETSPWGEPTAALKATGARSGRSGFTPSERRPSPEPTPSRRERIPASTL